MTHHVGLLQMDCESAPLTAPARVAEFDWDDRATVGVHPVENITRPPKKIVVGWESVTLLHTHPFWSSINKEAVQLSNL